MNTFAFSRLGSTSASPLVEALEPRIAPAAGLPTLDLSALGGTSGFHLQSPVALEQYSSAGDFNGDGIGDLLALSFSANSNKGVAYVLFGKAGGFGKDFDLASLNGTNGFVINGEASGDKFGISASAGDVNNDGKSDLIIGAPGNDAGGSNAGAAYVIFGTTNPGATVQLSSLNGMTGFKITGTGTGSSLGQSVASGGDYNADGYDDLIIGAPDSDAYGSNAGAAYVVFGNNSSFPATLSTSSLNGTNGFAFASQATGERFGNIVGFAGDLNNDGYDDLTVGGSGTSGLALYLDGKEQDAAYFLFGRSSSNTLITVSQLASGNGYWMTDVGRAELGSFGFLQDMNGDGVDDFVTLSGQKSSFLFSTNGALGFSYIAGKPNTAFTTNPFINGIAKSTNIWTPFSSGVAYGSAADFNGDGYVDFIVDPTSDVVGNVIFGGKVSGTKYLGDSPLDKGFSVIGITSNTNSLSFLGDINGDGAPELGIIAGTGTDGYIVFGTGLNISADAKSATYRDGDGDLVTVKTSKGTFDYTQFSFSPEKINGGKDLLKIDLGIGGPEFSDADLTVTVKKGSLKGISNGLADVGKIDATGIDLGKITIAGHLGEIDAGDAIASDLAMASLSTKGLGGPGVSSSEIMGAIGKVTILGDFSTTLRTSGSTAASIAAFTVSGKFHGELNVAGSLAGFSSAAFLDGSKLVSATPAEKPTALTFHEVGDFTVINLAGSVSTLKATRIGESTILADRIASLLVTGVNAKGIRGDFLGSLTLDNGGGTFTPLPVLGKASIAGLVQTAQFTLSGSLGTFTAAAMESSSLFVGFTPSNPASPLSGGTFASDSEIKKITITGRVSTPGSQNGEALDSSFIIASRIGSATLASLDSVGGSLTWGFAYDLTAGKITSKTPPFTFDPKNSPTATLGDFSVIRI